MPNQLDMLESLTERQQLPKPPEPVEVGPKQTELIAVLPDARGLNPNPMVRKHGFGPAGIKCKRCWFLRVNKPGVNKYFKCHWRGITNGTGTDHRVGWDACSKFDTKQEPVLTCPTGLSNRIS